MCYGICRYETAMGECKGARYRKESDAACRTEMTLDDCSEWFAVNRRSLPPKEIEVIETLLEFANGRT